MKKLRFILSSLFILTLFGCGNSNSDGDIDVDVDVINELTDFLSPVYQIIVFHV